MIAFVRIRRRQSDRQLSFRRGGLLVEVILVLPLLLAALLALVEFGVLLAHLKHVDQAAAVGARFASRQSPADFESGRAIEGVERQVAAVLATAGLRAACRVDLEHNLPQGGSTAQTAGTCDHSLPAGQGLPQSADLRAVRVSVWMDLSALAPDLLASLGYSLEGRWTRSQVTFPSVYSN
jgi:hypothetical protein